MNGIVAAYLNTQEVVKRVRDTLKTEKEKAAVRALEGNVFCFTGKMSRVRHVIQRELLDLGGDYTTNFTNGVSIVVRSHDGWKSTKVVKAMERNIPVITENEYMKLIQMAVRGANKE